MATALTRREILKFAGGALAGSLFTPIPWKLIDDLAIWSQTADRIPKLARGPITTRAAVCTLCPAGCAVRVSCVAGRPYSVLPVAIGPGGRSAVCALGLAAHHAAGHPRRLSGPVARLAGSGSAGARVEPVEAGAVRAALASALSDRAAGRRRDRVVILDGRPGRAISAFYRSFLARVPGGVYAAAVPPEERSLRALRSAIQPAPEEIGFALDRATRILGIGAPLLEGWGGAASSACLSSRRCGDGAGLSIVQAEARPSGTALRSDRWLRIRPGTETALVLGLVSAIAADPRGTSGVFDRESLARLAALFPPDRAAATTGLSELAIRETAAFLAAGRSVAIGGGDAGGGPLPESTELAVSCLNLLLGVLEPGGCARSRRALPLPGSLRGEDLAPPSRLEDLPDGSVGVLIVDAAPWGAALPMELLDRKLAHGRSLFISFSPYRIGHAERADFVVPAPAWLEAEEEIPTPPAAPLASFALSPALIHPRPGSMDPAVFLASAAAAAGIDLPGRSDTAALVEQRIAAIHEAGRGEVVPCACAKPSAIAAFGSPALLAKALREGAFWRDEPCEETRPSAFRFAPSSVEKLELAAAAAAATTIPGAGPADPYPLLLIPFGRAGLCGEGPVPSLIEKLYRESGLREGGGSVLVHPRTAGACGLKDGEIAVVETRNGRIEARVVFDADVTPEFLYADAGPTPGQLGREGARGLGVLDLCAAGPADDRWAAPARMGRLT